LLIYSRVSRAITENKKMRIIAGEENEQLLRTVSAVSLLSCRMKLTGYLLFAAFLHCAKYHKERAFPFTWDWKNFISVSQRCFSELKKRTQGLLLTAESSKLFHDSPTFRAQVLSKVKDPGYLFITTVCYSPFLVRLGSVKALILIATKFPYFPLMPKKSFSRTVNYRRL
jgi:hypothetical protein